MAIRQAEDQTAAIGETIGLLRVALLVARDGTEHPIADSCAPIRDERGWRFTLDPDVAVRLCALFELLSEPLGPTPALSAPRPVVR